MKLPLFVSLLNRSAAVAFGFALTSASHAASFVNGGFESPDLGGTAFSFQPTMPGWQTTDPYGFEIWSHGFGGVTSYEGNQHVELNASQAGTLSQDVAGIPAGARVGFEFAHRGRLGVDVMAFTLTDLGANGVIGGGDDSVLFTKQYSDGNTAWRFYNAAGEGPIIADGNNIRFSYEAVSAAGGDVGIGNFLDAANFGVSVGLTAVPEAGSALPLLAAAFAGLAWFNRRQPKPRCFVGMAR